MRSYKLFGSGNKEEDGISVGTTRAGRGADEVKEPSGWIGPFRIWCVADRAEGR